MARVTSGNTQRQRNAQAIAVELQRRVEQIRGDQRLSDLGRSQRIAAEYREAKAEIDKLAAVEREANAATQQRLEREVFGLPGKADPAAAISYRDAMDRAAQLVEQTEAVTLLGRAERSGDEVLVKAIAQRGVEMGWPQVIDIFAGTRPEMGRKLSELQDLVGGSTSAHIAKRLGAEMSFSLSTPTELRNLSASQVDQLAEGDMEVSW